MFCVLFKLFKLFIISQTVWLLMEHVETVSARAIPSNADRHRVAICIRIITPKEKRLRMDLFKKYNCHLYLPMKSTYSRTFSRGFETINSVNARQKQSRYTFSRRRSTRLINYLTNWKYHNFIKNGFKSLRLRRTYQSKRESRT